MRSVELSLGRGSIYAGKGRGRGNLKQITQLKPNNVGAVCNPFLREEGLVTIQVSAKRMGRLMDPRTGPTTDLRTNGRMVQWCGSELTHLYFDCWTSLL